MSESTIFEWKFQRLWWITTEKMLKCSHNPIVFHDGNSLSWISCFLALIEWSILQNVMVNVMYFKLQSTKMRVETGNCNRFTRYVIRLIWPQNSRSELFILWALQRYFHRYLRIWICTDFTTDQPIRVRARTAESFFVRPFWPKSNTKDESLLLLSLLGVRSCTWLVTAVPVAPTGPSVAAAPPSPWSSSRPASRSPSSSGWGS